MSTNRDKGKHKTIRKQDICNPIILREGPQVRLSFSPMLVSDPDNPSAEVAGTLAYERKSTNGRWLDIGESLANLRADEGVKIPVGHVELRKLLEGLVPLFKLYKTGVDRPVIRPKTVQEGKSENLSGSGDHRGESETQILIELADWIRTEQGQIAAQHIATLDLGKLTEISAALGLSALKAAFALYTENQKNDSESFWQETLERRSFILNQLFAYPVLVFGTKAYVGGKQIDNKGGRHPDFLLNAVSTNSLLIVEIKTPVTRLLGSEYRNGIFPLSTEIQGAIAQALRYRQSLARSFDVLTSEIEQRVILGEPRCILLAGHTSELDSIVSVRGSPFFP